MKKILISVLCLVLILSLTGFTRPEPVILRASDSGSAAEKQEEGEDIAFPEKPITIICPWDAGGGADAICRMFEKLGPKYFGQSIVIVNKAGAGGQLATAEYKTEKPDGYTVLFSSNGLFSTQPFMGEVAYSMDDFTPITGITADYNMLAVNASLGVSNVEELVEHYKESGETLYYGHSGTGAVPHIGQALLYHAAGINAQDVPYNSAAETIPALLGGHVMAIAQGSAEMMKLVGSDDAVVIGYFGPERNPSEIGQTIPTIKEQGYDITLGVWRMFLVNKDTPEDVCEKLREGFRAVIEDPEFVEFATAQGYIIDPKEPQVIIDTLNQEYSDSEALFKELGIGIYAE